MPFSTLDNSISRLPKGYKQTPQTIGEHLLKVRIDRNLSKKVVADQIGVSPSTIAAWEQEKGKPKVRQMKSLIAFLGFYPLPEPTTLGERIRKYRHVHGLILEELGTLLGFDGATVWTWENGTYAPLSETVHKIEEFLLKPPQSIPAKSIENPQTVGEHIKKRRLALGLLQKDVARLWEVSEDTITSWENDRSEPQIRQYPKIIHFCGYNMFARDTKSIGGQIYRYRTENGLSFRELTKFTGFDADTLATWEENISIPSVEDRMKLVIFEIIK